MTTYKTLFETGEGDGYWCIEQTPDGMLCLTTNAETRNVFGPDSYRGWDADEFRAALEKDGVPADVIGRVLEQAGLA